MGNAVGTLGLPEGFLLDQNIVPEADPTGLPEGFAIDQPAEPQQVQQPGQEGSRVRLSPFDPAKHTAQLSQDQGPQEGSGSFGDGLLRQLGLTGRAGAEGIAGLIGIAYDPIAALLNVGLSDESQIPPLRQNINQRLTEAGVPNPETVTERIVQEASQALVGAGGTVAVARGAGKLLAGQVGQRVAGAVAQAPGAQIVGGATSGGAAQTAAEAGAGAAGQFAASLIGGGLATGGTTRAGGRGATTAAAPRPGRVDPPSLARPEVTPQSLADDAARAAAPVTDDVALDVGRTVAAASRGNKAARANLAELSRVNPEALAAANRLGIDLPPDVFSDNVMLQSAAGLSRSQAGSAAEADWVNAIRAAADKADEAVATLGGTKDISRISQDVFDSLATTRTTLGDDAASLYSKVDAAIKNPTVIGTPSLNRALTGLIQDVGEEGLSAAEKKLLRMASNPGGVTYGRLMRERSLIGKAIGRGTGPYADVEHGALKRLYGALSEDQMGAARAIGGDEVADALNVANGLTAKKKALEASIVGAFGSDLEGSIARRLETAISQAGKGDLGNLNRMLNVIPEDLRSEAILTGIMSATKSKSAASALPPGSFGFAEYAKFYGSLRQNREALKSISKSLTPDTRRVLEDLFAVSRRITDARGKVLSTGKANQALVQGMTAENIFGRIMGSSSGQLAATGAGALGGGPVGAMAAQGIAKALASGKTDPLIAAGRLFRDDAFMKMMEASATTGNASRAQINAAANSSAFRRWAKIVKIPEPRAWLISAASRSAAQPLEQPEEGAQ